MPPSGMERIGMEAFVHWGAGVQGRRVIEEAQ